MENVYWFLSALSQSAAAIVGLIGALLGSRLISQIEEIKQRRYNEKNKIMGLYNNINSQLKWFESLKKFAEQRTLDYREAREEGRNVMAFPNNRGLSFDSGVTEIPNIKEDLIRLEFVKEIIPDFVKIWEKTKKAKRVEDLKDCYSLIDSLKYELDGKRKKFFEPILLVSPFKELDDALNKLLNLKDCIEKIVKGFQSFQKNLLPKYFIWLLILLIFITTTSVFLPLLFLYGHFALTRELILILLFTVGISGLIAYLIFQIVSIWRMGNSEKIIKESKKKSIYEAGINV